MANADVSEERQARMQRQFFLAIGYLFLLPILVYPTLFIAAQDLPNIPTLSLLRYTYFTPNPNQFRSHLTGLVFSFVFISGFAVLFLRPASLRLIGIGTVLMTLAYYPIASLSHFLFDIGAAARTSPLIEGWSYFLAAGVAIPIMRLLAGRKPGEPAAGRPSFSSILWLLNTFALLGFTLLYPYVTLSLVVLLTEGGTTIRRLFEPLGISFSSLVFQTVAVASVVGYGTIVAFWLFRAERLKFILSFSAVCYFLFCLFAYGAVALYVKLSTAQVTTGCRLLSDWSSCLSIAHYSWVFGASVSISILTANLFSRYQAHPPVFRF